MEIFDTLIDVLILIVVIVGLYYICTIGKRQEEKIWNEGICTDCGDYWKFLYEDIMNNKIYRCRKCEKEIKISWECVTNKVKTV